MVTIAWPELDDLHLHIGRCITALAGTETALRMIAQQFFFGLPTETVVAVTNTPRDFGGLLEFTKQVGKAAVTEDRRAEFDALMKRAKVFADFRNRVAHLSTAAELGRNANNELYAAQWVMVAATGNVDEALDKLRKGETGPGAAIALPELEAHTLAAHELHREMIAFAAQLSMGNESRNEKRQST